MGLGSFTLQLALVFCLTVFLLNKYGNWRKQTLIVTLSTFIGWFFSFLIILVLPLDVSITFYKKCLLDENILNNVTISNVANTQNISLECEEPKGHVPDDTLLGLWRLVYWTSQLLTWVVLPILQSYSKAGEFTTLGRLKSAVYNNLIYYGTYGCIFFFLLVYAISKGVSLNFDHLKVLVISASNTWGLFLLVLLLGYGLIEVPRQLWQMGDRGYRLSKTYFDIDKLSIDKNDAEETIQEVYREAKEVMNVLKGTRGNAREKAQQIMSKFPHDLSRRLNSSRSAPNFGNSSNITDADIRLHKRVIDAVQDHHRCQAQWKSLICNALYLEDIELAEATRQLPPKWTTIHALDSSATSKPKNSGFLGSNYRLPHSARFLWHVTLKRPLYLTFGIICAMMTGMIVWSECTFFVVYPQLSLAARILHSAAHGYHYKYIQMCAILIIFYLGVCAYYTIFRLRIYRYYHLDPHQLTDENSLIFSAMLLCRLTAPMCLNFLGMVHLDSHITSDAKFGVETQFTKLMGHLDVIPLLAKGINIYLPILIVLLCLGTWFRLGTRLLHSLGIDQFLDEDEMTGEMVQGGKALVTLERNRINRERGREERNKAWTNNKSLPTNKDSYGGKSANTRLAMDYSDREPIMEHQENNGLIEEFEANNISLEAAENESFLFSNTSSGNKGVAPSKADLEFGTAFGTSPSASGAGGGTSAKDRVCPAPSSIFDDL